MLLILVDEKSILSSHSTEMRPLKGMSMAKLRNGLDGLMERKGPGKQFLWISALVIPSFHVECARSAKSVSFLGQSLLYFRWIATNSQYYQLSLYVTVIIVKQIDSIHQSNVYQMSKNRTKLINYIYYNNSSSANTWYLCVDRLHMMQNKITIIPVFFFLLSLLLPFMLIMMLMICSWSCAVFKTKTKKKSFTVNHITPINQLIETRIN